MDIEFLIWGLAAGIFHLVIGYTVVYFLTNSHPQYGAVGSLIPDIDHLLSFLGTPFPIYHRGITHTPLVLFIVVGALLLLDRKTHKVQAIGIGYLSHLVIDSFSGWGVLWLWPLSTKFIRFGSGSHNIVLEWVVITAILFVLLLLPKYEYLGY